MALQNHHSLKHMKQTTLCITYISISVSLPLFFDNVQYNYSFILVDLTYSFNINSSGDLNIKKI
jgi:hypothetical protein